MYLYLWTFYNFAVDDPQQSNCNEEIEKNTIFTNTESAYKIQQEFIEVDLSPVEVNTQSMSATTNNNMTEVVEIKSFNVGAGNVHSNFMIDF